MRVLLSAVLLSVFLVGCTTKPPKTEIVYVKVPVAVFPKAPVTPERPVLLSTTLGETTPVDEAVSMIVVDFERVLSYSKQLENILKVYINDVATTAKEVEKQQ